MDKKNGKKAFCLGRILLLLAFVVLILGACATVQPENEFALGVDNSVDQDQAEQPVVGFFYRSSSEKPDTQDQENVHFPQAETNNQETLESDPPSDALVHASDDLFQIQGKPLPPLDGLRDFSDLPLPEKPQVQSGMELVESTAGDVEAGQDATEQSMASNSHSTVQTQTQIVNEGTAEADVQSDLYTDYQPQTTVLSDLHAPPPDIGEVEPLEQVQSEVGQNFTVIVFGDGWIYLGEENGSRDVRFLSRTIDEQGNTVFSFSSSTEGAYRLQFQRQDLGRGITERSLVQAAIFPQGYLVESEENENQLSVEDETEPLYSASNIRQNSFSDNQDRTGTAVDESDQFDSVRFDAGLSASQTLSSPEETLSTAVERGDSQSLVQLLRQQSPEQLVASADMQAAIQAVRMLANAGSLVEAQDLLEYIRENGDADQQARSLFYLGNLFEEPTVRNYRRALSFYDMLQQLFPYHELASPAGVRSRYLRRHFFDIR